ncbi:NAD(P)H-hydrate dehydratase [Undibacterium flavidum]|uniref:Bifunctional NAD(P)H-hydrate repair enzyme n=1 Tax=Undibacterium flavidum TaxID=2762297 RepID=A0ABR6Y6R2_9BURK|nr:NAD(P)H-hydrate dehydratase [Undibacterium flavidum]MBC3872280.1 NAD(P)H-hydrate dehydratase [Undibacterium flavidum]
MSVSSKAHLPAPQIASQGLYQAQQIQAIEATAKKTLPVGALMRAAGIAAAKLALSLLPKARGKVLILAGPGDNGGDALEVAHLLAEEGLEIHVLLLGTEQHYSRDARQSLHRAQHSQLRWISQAEVESLSIKHWDLVIDGLFGIGLKRPLEGAIASLITHINNNNPNHQTPILALDIPSGLNVDTGTIPGDQHKALQATHTISFIANKVGLHTAQGKDYAGQVHIDGLGLAPTIYPPAYAHLLTEKTFINSMPKRQHDSHKGTYGTVLVVGGNNGMTGAPLLAGRAALYCGAGRVHLGFLGNFNPVDHLHPELMCRSAEDSDYISAIVAIGPGLGSTDNAKLQLQRALQESTALVIDADALNLIASHEYLQELVKRRSQQDLRTIITPHPLEVARLLKTTVPQIQADRCTAAKKLVDIFQACVILKGAGSIIADADYLWINSSGNPALATAGTGDVLTGVCAALLAQGLGATHAACLAVYLHGKGADDCILEEIGPIGLTANELIPAIRSALNKLTKSGGTL